MKRFIHWIKKVINIYTMPRVLMMLDGEGEVRLGDAIMLADPDISTEWAAKDACHLAKVAVKGVNFGDEWILVGDADTKLRSSLSPFFYLSVDHSVWLIETYSI